MATEPVSGFALGALLKALVAAGAGVLGALVMAAFDPPKTRRDLFIQAAVAGAGSFVFGPAALTLASHALTSVAVAELSVPVYFLVGSLSWGAFAALAKLRTLVAEKGADKVAEKVGLEDKQ